MCDLVYFLELKEWIEVLASVGTLFSILIAIATLFEVKRQRESSYKPDLYLSFYPSNEVSIQQDSDDLDIKYWESEEERHGFLISIENIGSGAAKDVQIEWVFNFKKAIQVVKKLKDYSFSNYDGGFKASLPDKEKLVHFHYDLFERFLEYDFVLPRKDEVFKKGCSLPTEILELHVIYIVLKYELFRGNVARSFFEGFEDFPEIKAKAKYFDIGGKKHTKNFDVKLSGSINSWTEMYTQTDSNKLKFTMYPEFIAVK